MHCLSSVLNWIVRINFRLTGNFTSVLNTIQKLNNRYSYELHQISYLQLARLIALNVLSNASYDGAALSVDGANPSIARDITTTRGVLSTVIAITYQLWIPQCFVE